MLRLLSTHLATEIQVEPWSACIGEMEELFPAHWKELARFQDEIPLKCDHERYRNPRLINKILDDFSDDELDNIRSTYLESTRFRHNFGDIGPEAWKTMSLQTYFPDVKIPQNVLNRVQNAITRSGAPAPASSSPPPEGDLVDILQKSLEAAKQKTQ